MTDSNDIVSDGCDECAVKDREIKRLKRQHLAFKVKVRDRAIWEADRRNWCGEFDEALKDLGLAGRWNEYTVTVTGTLVGCGIAETLDKKVLAWSDDHANELVVHYWTRNVGYTDVTVVRTVRMSDGDGELVGDDSR